MFWSACQKCNRIWKVWHQVNATFWKPPCHDLSIGEARKIDNIIATRRAMFMTNTAMLAYLLHPEHRGQLLDPAQKRQVLNFASQVGDFIEDQVILCLFHSTIVFPSGPPHRGNCEVSWERTTLWHCCYMYCLPILDCHHVRLTSGMFGHNFGGFACSTSKCREDLQ